MLAAGDPVLSGLFADWFAVITIIAFLCCECAPGTKQQGAVQIESLQALCCSAAGLHKLMVGCPVSSCTAAVLHGCTSRLVICHDMGGWRLRVWQGLQERVVVWSA